MTVLSTGQKTHGDCVVHQSRTYIADDIKKTLGRDRIADRGLSYILLRLENGSFLGSRSCCIPRCLDRGDLSLTYKIMPFNMEINQAFIAAVLTVIGYCSTMVVFDCIREYVGEHTKWKFTDTVNAALNSTLSRTLNTSLTTLMFSWPLYFYGESIRGFMFALIVGVIVGTIHRSLLQLHDV